MTDDGLRMMSPRPNKRPLAITISLISLVLLALAAAILYILTTYPFYHLLNRPPQLGPPVAWTGLPLPKATRSRWTSFTNTDRINAVLSHEGLLWAATDGGVVVWDQQSGDSVKFTAEHGLAENRVTSVAVAPNGVLWLGTAGSGLNRYDGNTWQTFTEADGLPSNAVRDVVVGSDGTVWAATANGVGRYDGRRWYNYSPLRTLGNLPGNNVRALTRVNGQVWAATDNGLGVYDGRGWDAITVDDGLTTNDVYDVAATSDGMIWAATSGGLQRYDGLNWEFFSTFDGLVSNDVRLVAAAPDNSVWLAYHSDSQAGTSISHFQTNSSLPQTETVEAPVRSLYVDHQGVLWVGTAKGLLTIDVDGQRQQYRTAPDLPASSYTNLATSENSIWLAGPEGVAAFVEQSWTTFSEVDGLNSSTVQSLSIDPQGRPWIAYETFGAGLSRYNQAGQWESSTCSESAFEPGATSHDAQIEDLAMAATGTAWLSTNFGMIGLTKMLDSDVCNEVIADRFIRGETILADAAGGVWFIAGAEANYLQSIGTFYDATDYRWETAFSGVAALAPDGSLWAASGSEIIHFPNQGQPTALSVDVEAIAAAEITALAIDAGYRIWVGTTAGAAMFDGQSWAALTTQDGLGNNEVTAIAISSDGSVWFLTAGGLSQYVP